MFVSVTPQQAWGLISRGEVEVVDVRDASEFAAGHVPGARLVSLADLRAHPAKHLPREGVLFVCAGGVRSQTAARAAAEAGIARVYSLVGGTQSWIKAGLPIDKLRAA